VRHTVLEVVFQGDLDATPGSSKDVRRMETPQWAIHQRHGRLTLVGRLRSAWVKETACVLRHLVGVDGATLRRKGSRRQTDRNISRRGQRGEVLQSARRRRLDFEIK